MLTNFLNVLIVTVVFITGSQLVRAQVDNSVLLEKLVKVSSVGHPFHGELKDLLKLPIPDPSQVAEKFDPALAENTKLSPEEKQFVKANYEKLAGLVNDKMLLVTGRHIKFSDWLTAFLTQTYAKELTPDEMRGWISYFESSDGKILLKTVFAMPQPTDPDSQALIKKFEKDPIGMKFIQIFGNSLEVYMQAKLSEVETAVKEDYRKLFAPTELNKLFNQFVAENYKK